jgi:hypothetical protein
MEETRRDVHLKYWTRFDEKIPENGYWYLVTSEYSDDYGTGPITLAYFYPGGCNIFEQSTGKKKLTRENMTHWTNIVEK